MWMKPGGKAGGDATEFLLQPKIAHQSSRHDSKLPPLTRHVDFVLVVRVKQQDGKVAVCKRLAPHLRAGFVVE